jgi:hypothetical protein
MQIVNKKICLSKESKFIQDVALNSSQYAKSRGNEGKHTPQIYSC